AVAAGGVAVGPGGHGRDGPLAGAAGHGLVQRVGPRAADRGEHLPVGRRGVPGGGVGAVAGADQALVEDAVPELGHAHRGLVRHVDDPAVALGPEPHGAGLHDPADGVGAVGGVEADDLLAGLGDDAG